MQELFERPELYRYDTGYGIVVRSYDTWEVDIAPEDGGLLRRAQVLGTRLPEPSSPERPQWVIYWFAQHDQAQCWCLPVPSRLPGTRDDRRRYVWYDEVANYRLTINRDGELEVRNLANGSTTRLLIREQGNHIILETPSLRAELLEDERRVRVETPATHVELDDSGKLVELDATNIHLGEGATEQLVLGTTFLAWLQSFIAVFDSHTHPDTGANQNPAPALPVILSDVSRTK